jgi:hypothetical protein
VRQEIQNGIAKSSFTALSRVFDYEYLTGVLIFKGLTARRIYKSFGVKGLILLCGAHKLFRHIRGCLKNPLCSPTSFKDVGVQYKDNSFSHIYVQVYL